MFMESSWDFLQGLRPTIAVGLSGKSIADREVNKRLLCSGRGYPAVARP
jgi:hypothetical protein